MEPFNYNFDSVNERINEFQEGNENLYDNFKTAAEEIRNQVNQIPELIPNYRHGLMLAVLFLLLGQITEEAYNNAFASPDFEGFKEAVNAYKELIETLYGDNDIYLEGAHAIIAKELDNFPFVEQPAAPEPQPQQHIGGKKRKTRRQHYRKARKFTRKN